MKKRTMAMIAAWGLIVILLPAGVVAEEDLQFEDILAILAHSGKPLNYLGTKFVIDYTPAKRSTTLIKIAYNASGLQKKQVSSLQQGASQIILDDGKFLWHYLPSQASVVKKPRVPSFAEISQQIRRQNQLIRLNYTITIATPQASRLSANMPQIPSVSGDVNVTFAPKTPDRPSWKIWIDSAHGLVVRTEVYTIDGQLALLSAFSELTFEPKFPQQEFVLTVPKGTKITSSVEKTFHTIEEAQAALSFPIVAPQYLPTGFVLAAVISAATARSEKVQLAYSDGLSSLSVFAEKRPPTPANAVGQSKEITINRYVKGTFRDQGLLKILNWQQTPEIQVTLVGEVADAELAKVAASLSGNE